MSKTKLKILEKFGSLRAFSKHTGINYTTVCNIIRRVALLPDSYIEKFTENLGFTIDELRKDLLLIRDYEIKDYNTQCE